MKVSFDVNVKAVLSVAAVVVIAVGSFFAGAHHQAHKTQIIGESDIASPLMIPNGITEEAWCAGHHSTNWMRNPDLFDQTAKEMGEPASPLSGACGSNGDVWDDVSRQK